MNYLKFLIIATISIFLISCWSAEEKKAPSASTNTESSDITANNTDDLDKEDETGQIDTDDAEPKQIYKDGKVDTKAPDGELSPTDTLKEFDVATLSQDPERIKKVVTKSTIKYLEGEAKKQGMTFEQMVKQPNQMPTVEAPETRNEKIDGNKATVEAKNRILGTYDTYPLTKEDGIWKVEFDKYLKQKMKELNEGPKLPGN